VILIPAYARLRWTQYRRDCLKATVADEQAAADAGRDRQVEARLQLARRSVEVLGQPGGVGVGLEHDPLLEPLLERLDDGRVLHARDVGREEHLAVLVVERSGRADADGQHIPVAAFEERPGGACQSLRDVLEARLRRLDAVRVQDASVLHHRRGDLGAAEVETQRPHERPPAARAPQPSSPAVSPVASAIMRSSSVATTSTSTPAPSTPMRVSPRRLRSASMRTPRNPSPARLS